MAECVGSPYSFTCVAFPLGSFGKDHQRIVAGIVVLVGNQDFDQVRSFTLYSGMQQRTEVT